MSKRLGRFCDMAHFSAVNSAGGCLYALQTIVGDTYGQTQQRDFRLYLWLKTAIPSISVRRLKKIEEMRSLRESAPLTSATVLAVGPFFRLVEDICGKAFSCRSRNYLGNLVCLIDAVGILSYYFLSVYELSIKRGKSPIWSHALLRPYCTKPYQSPATNNSTQIALDIHHELKLHLAAQPS